MTDAASPARDSRSPADVTPQEKRLTFIALMIVFLLAALDMTIIATAMPRIVADLQGLDLYPWVTTIYLLTSTVMVPIWGKLGDLFGRKIILISGVCIFVVGSWLCGISGEFGELPILGGGMMQLIIFRGLQGIGGGALFTSAFGVIADMFPPRERAKYAGLFGAVFGVSSILGPLIGGYFTDHGSVTLGGLYIAGWRWVFYVNLPLSVLALAMIALKMPDLRHRDGGKIDILGGALVIVGVGALLLALSWGGRDYGWASPTILGLFIFSAAVIAGFIFVESKFSEPILPLELFKIRAFSTSNLAAAIMGMAFMGTIVYLPLYLQLGLGVTATTSGLSMLPLMIGLTASAAFFGRMVRETGYYRRYILAGCTILAVGLFLLAQLGPGAALWQVNWRLVVVGIGLGPSQSLFTIIVQNAAPMRQLGVATSTIQFFRQIGSTIGVAIFGALLIHELTVQFARVMPGVEIDLGQLRALTVTESAGPIIVPAPVQEAFASTMTVLFLAGILITALAAAATALIPHEPLRDHFTPKAEPVAEPGEGEHDVTQAGKAAE